MTAVVVLPVLVVDVALLILSIHSRSFYILTGVDIVAAHAQSTWVRISLPPAVSSLPMVFGQLRRRRHAQESIQTEKAFFPKDRIIQETIRVR